jgi:hypothetical protein
MDNPNLNKHNPLPFLQQAGLEEVEDFHQLLDLKGWAQYHRWLLRLISEQQDVVFAALTKERSWEEMKKLEGMRAILDLHDQAVNRRQELKDAGRERAESAERDDDTIGGIYKRPRWASFSSRP